MNLVSVFSLRIVTLQMSVVTICTGCWLVGELLLVFFYKASQPPQSSKSKQWYPGSTRGFSGTDFPFFRGAFEMRTRHRCLAWESITAELTAIKLWCPRGSVLITSEPCENPTSKLSFHALSHTVQRERTGSANWSWPAWGQTWY